MIYFLFRHYAKCDVISEENKQFKLKYLINKTLQCKSKKKNFYYSFKYSFTSYNNNFRVIGTLIKTITNKSFNCSNSTAVQLQYSHVANHIVFQVCKNTYMLFTGWEVRTRKIFCRGLRSGPRP